jgi:hypothetical protein
MSFEARCPQCLFVSRQLGQPTPCLLHVSLAVPDCEPEPVEAPRDYDEPYVFGQCRPTVDQPGPFTLRQYVRLQLLRSRIQAAPSPLDQSEFEKTKASSLSRR